MTVREAALGTLQTRRHPALPELATEQFRDCDEQVRFLGLDHLKFVAPSIGVPSMMIE